MAVVIVEQPKCSAAVVTSDTAVQNAPNGIWVGGAGNITGRLRNDTADVVWVGIPAGTYLPGDWVLIKLATTATNIVALGFSALTDAK